MRPPSALLVPLLVASCFSPSLDSRPFLCGTADPPCPAGYTCGHDGVCSGGPDTSDATIGDAAPTADATACTRNAFLSCKNVDVARFCNAGGNGIVERSCPVGCDSVLERCLVLQPSGLPAACDPPASTPATSTITVDVNWNTDSCVMLGGLIVPQGVGLPELCVVRFSDFAVTTTGTFRITGKRALVVIALDHLRLAGTLDVSGEGTAGGAGASGERQHEHGGSAAANTSEGGGGGGHAGSGGSGGPSEAGDVVYPGGASVGAPNLSPLTTGGFGGAGGYPCGEILPCPSMRVAGGGGGGAVQLIACSELTIETTAILDAGGGGGPGGNGATGTLLPGGGDGGGAGGGILIEAPTISVPTGATLTANGGGGGGGGAPGALAGKPGSDGLTAARPAPGGKGALQSAGDGGEGGASDHADDGKKGTSGGGGGGAPGRIRLNARQDRLPTVAGGAIVSPPATSGAVGRK